MPPLMFSLIACLIVNNIKCNTINCDGASQCGPCTGSGTCELICDAYQECRYDTLTCKSNAPCTVKCYGSGGACQDATIQATQATNLYMDCIGYQNCVDTIVNAGDGDVTVVCDSGGGTNCNRLELHATNAQDVSINCPVYWSCVNMKIWCGTGTCFLDCSGETDGCQGLWIDASKSSGFTCLGDPCVNGDVTVIQPIPATDTPTTSLPTTATPTTANPTTSNPTTSLPTTSFPTTSFPTTNIPTTTIPTTAFPTTNNPTTSMPTTQNPTTVSPTDTPSINPTQSPNIDPPTNNPTKIPTASPSNKPSKKPSFKPTISPTRNDNAGAIDENESTQSIQDKNDNKSAGSANAGIFSDDNDTLIMLLAFIIGSLGCCILVLSMCYFYGKKKANKVEKNLEMERIVSTSTIVRTGENKHTNVATGSMEVNRMLTLSVTDSPAIVDDNKMDLNRLMAMSIQSNVNNVNVNSHNKHPSQQSMIILPPQPMVNNNMFGMSGEGTALKMWLLKCGVPQYYDIFVREGFQLATVVTLTDNDLQKIGIMKLAHRKVILNQIDIMKMDQNNSQYEGGVLDATELNDLPQVYNNDFDGGTAGGLNSSDSSSDTDRDANIYKKQKQETTGQ